MIGCLLVVLGFFLPWGPAGPWPTAGFKTLLSVEWTPNPTDRPVGLGGLRQLLPGESLCVGPLARKIVDPRGQVREIFGPKSYGEDTDAWAYTTLALGVSGVAFGLVGLNRRYGRVVHPCLLLVSAAALALPVIFVVVRIRPALREGISLAEALTLLAPFGDIDFCAGLLTTMAGALVAAVASGFLTRISWAKRSRSS